MSTCTVALTDHAVERFNQRVRPCLSADQAADELERLLGLGQFVAEAPAWFAERARQDADAYVVVGDIVLPLIQDAWDVDDYVIPTCIARGGLSDLARRRRNDRRRRRRFER